MIPGEPLWTAREIALVTGGRTDGGWFADGIAIDSREVVPGDLFVALAGDRRDGHAFVAEAFAAGAAGALVSGPVAGIAADDPRLVCVADSFEALRELAAARRKLCRSVIAVTGSAGKTSVKEALRLALGRERLAHASIRSFNNHVGVPLSLARMPRSARFAVLELGMNAPGEIGRLARIVKPDVAVVTNVGPAHRAAFEDERAIAAAKAEIFEGTAPGGTAVLGIDHAHAGFLVDAARRCGLEVITVSLEREDADVRPLRIVAGEDVSCLTACLCGQLVTLKIGAPGLHWVRNGLLTLAAVGACGGDVGLAALALAEVSAPAGRGRTSRVETRDGEFLLIDDSYNANPLSLAAALARLGAIRPASGGRRIAILADMEELGSGAERLHLDLAPDLRAAGVAEVLAVGPFTAALAGAAGVPCTPCADAGAALKAVRRRVLPGDVLLVKGANRANLATVVAGLLDLGETRRTGAALAAE